MHTWFRRALFGAAAVATVMVPQRTSAQAAPVSGVWHTFEFFEDPDVGFPSPNAGDGFSCSAGAGQQVRLRIVDLGVSGDRFNLFANGVLQGAT
ncbi:hypothetical protein [Gemmatimonas sp.]|jgi:hypothetical protein|uniref:hypothetical protein n=1 Tax=Gemmatimonas sp. TaxID=1962908 RepID=UPI0022C9ABF9|nr:hypothetical protein [Gemmatimonas sp.]MCZ8206473.1 hypothetical protein [Gemmatimonas sp.]